MRLLSVDYVSKHSGNYALTFSATGTLPEESGSENEIPFKKDENVEEDEEDGLEEVEYDDDEEVFIIDEILEHKTMNRILKYKVKWQGYPNEEDMTWEPEENL